MSEAVMKVTSGLDLLDLPQAPKATKRPGLFVHVSQDYPGSKWGANTPE
jgi:hypothetical protein